MHMINIGMEEPFAIWVPFPTPRTTRGNESADPNWVMRNMFPLPHGHGKPEKTSPKSDDSGSRVNSEFFQM